MTHKSDQIPAMDCWHFIAPLIPINGDQMSIDIYVETFHAFQLLEKEQESASKVLCKKGLARGMRKENG